MGWKQTLILGGAVLLLAACDRATAPVLNVREGGAAANFLFGVTSDTTTADSDTATADLLGDCRSSGISLSSGRDDTSCSGE